MCSVEGCERPSRARGWCAPHYKRWKKYGDPLVIKKAPNGVGHFDSRGYRKFGNEFEHRLVMSAVIGRPLTGNEVVHHINEKPSDNSRENLLLFPDNAAHKAWHGWLRHGAHATVDPPPMAAIPVGRCQ